MDEISTYDRSSYRSSDGVHFDSPTEEVLWGHPFRSLFLDTGAVIYQRIGSFSICGTRGIRESETIKKELVMYPIFPWGLLIKLFVITLAIPFMIRLVIYGWSRKNSSVDIIQVVHWGVGLYEVTIEESSRSLFFVAYEKSNGLKCSIFFIGRYRNRLYKKLCGI